MHLYVFGSLCRGEVGFGSDVDLLAIVERNDGRFDEEMFSVYSYRRISELWKEGNPFAWHLATEAKPIFLSDGCDFLTELGAPGDYSKCIEDCTKFAALFEKSVDALKRVECSQIFELSNIFLAVRNFATCFALGKTKSINFSRQSAKRMGDRSLKISEETFSLLERARLLNTRGFGKTITGGEFDACFREICGISIWFKSLLAEINVHG